MEASRDHFNGSASMYQARETFRYSPSLNLIRDAQWWRVEYCNWEDPQDDDSPRQQITSYKGLLFTIRYNYSHCCRRFFRIVVILLLVERVSRADESLSNFSTKKTLIVKFKYIIYTFFSFLYILPSCSVRRVCVLVKTKISHRVYYV